MSFYIFFHRFAGAGRPIFLNSQHAHQLASPGDQGIKGPYFIGKLANDHRIDAICFGQLTASFGKISDMTRIDDGNRYFFLAQGDQHIDRSSVVSTRMAQIRKHLDRTV